MPLARRQIALACAAIAACSEPSYEGRDAATRREEDASDAAVTDARGAEPRDSAVEVADPRDSGEPADASPADAGRAMPEWAAPLLGRYAVRARFFGRGDGLGSAVNPLSNQWLMLGTVRFDAATGDVVLSAQPCEIYGQAALAGFIADLSVLYPNRLPAREFPLRSDGTTWWTEGAPLAYGFDFEPLVECKTPGARVRAHPKQSWLSDGFCTCPTDLTVLPALQTDCRINDVDLDLMQGATVVASGAVSGKLYVRLLDSAQMIDGTIDVAERKHTAFYKQSQDLQQLGCAPDPCVKSSSTACDPSLDPVLFVPIEDAKTCADVLRESAQLFGAEPLGFPASGC